MPSLVGNGSPTANGDEMWIVMGHIGSAVATGYWRDGHVFGANLCVFGDDPATVVARFPIVPESEF